MSLYGDSILNGAVFPIGHLPETPANFIRRVRPSWVVSDYTQIGDTAQAHLGAFLNDTLGRITVIQYGINDAGQAYPYETPLRAMLQRARAVGSVVDVTGLSQGPSAPQSRASYDDVAKRVAREEGATFLDWGTVVPVVTLDGLHPDQEYSRALTQRIVDALDTFAPECK